jgi:hemolysin D
MMPPSSLPPSADPAHQPAAHMPIPAPAHRWHDPLRLIQTEEPAHISRLVLRAVSVLVLLLIVWAAFGKLDIIATTEGKLVPQTLVKIVQPAESGVVQQLLVAEGDSVKAGQLLARLDTTLAHADRAGVRKDLDSRQMQQRRILAELDNQPMLPQAGDDPQLYAQVQHQYIAPRQAFLDSLDQEQSLLSKAQHEHRSAAQILVKLEQTLPIYERSADAYAKLEKEGFVSSLAAAEKQRDATEKARDLDAQQATIASLAATVAAESKKIKQMRSAYHSALQTELAEIRASIAQLQPSLDKSIYKASLMELRAPQDGVIKDLSTTTVGAVVQPGSVIMTLVPQDEQLYADVQVKNADVGFVQTGQRVHIKLAAYPFQKYGMLSGQVTHLSADASEANDNGGSGASRNNNAAGAGSSYKARVKLDRQTLIDPQGNKLAMTAGMQVIAEINQGKRTVLEYLLSPVQKAVHEAGREK